MFLPWSFFEMYFFFFVFQILLIRALEASLAFISRFHKSFQTRQYINSIRWIRQGGYLAMATTIFYSSKNRNTIAPSSARRLLIYVAGLTILASGLDIALKAIVHESVQGTNHSQLLVDTTNQINYALFASLPSWSVSAPSSAKVQDVLTNLINNTRNIPISTTNKLFMPVMMGYDDGDCSKLDFAMILQNTSLSNETRVSTGGCAVLSLTTDAGGAANQSASYMVQRDFGRAKIVMPNPSTLQNQTVLPTTGVYTADLTAILRLDRLDRRCLISNQRLDSANGSLVGISSMPTTVMTRCADPGTGNIISMSVSAIRFAVPRLQDYQTVTNTIFEDSVPGGVSKELITAMQESVDGVFYNQTGSAIEVKVSGTRVDFLFCSSLIAWNGIDRLIYCMYSVVSTIMASPQPMIPQIVERHGGVSNPFPSIQHFTATVILTHMPLSLATDNPTFDMDNIVNGTVDATSYLANLGQNFLVDWNTGGMFVLYDTWDLKRGYEFPTGLFYTVCVIMVACVLVWIASEVMLAPRFKRSMFWVLEKEIQERKGETEKPMLMKFEKDPVSLDGFVLVGGGGGTGSINMNHRIQGLRDLKEEYEE